MALLSKLTDKSREAICELRLEGYSYGEIADWLEQELGIEYTTQSVGNFFRSDEGKKLYEQVHDELKSEWKNEPFAEKYSRVHAYVEEMTRLKREMREHEVTSEEYQDLHGMFMQTGKRLHDELEKFEIDITDREVTSPEEDLFGEDGAAEKLRNVLGFEVIDGGRESSSEAEGQAS